MQVNTRNTLKYFLEHSSCLQGKANVIKGGNDQMQNIHHREREKKKNSKLTRNVNYY